MRTARAVAHRKGDVRAELERLLLVREQDADLRYRRLPDRRTGVVVVEDLRCGPAVLRVAVGAVLAEPDAVPPAVAGEDEERAGAVRRDVAVGGRGGACRERGQDGHEGHGGEATRHHACGWGGLLRSPGRSVTKLATSWKNGLLRYGLISSCSDKIPAAVERGRDDRHVSARRDRLGALRGENSSDPRATWDGSRAVPRGPGVLPPPPRGAPRLRAGRGAVPRSAGRPRVVPSCARASRGARHPLHRLGLVAARLRWHAPPPRRGTPAPRGRDRRRRREP